ncbi:MAG: HNH endonuclease [Planctomycetes bacterium]|nr:HNH endonuclease [Planctomycetota bacterium]
MTPYRDPARPNYNNGATHIDHAQARSLGGSNDPSNLRPLAAETNMRKGGHEGQLLAYEQYLIRNGMSPKDARSVIQAEIDSMIVSPPPRPMDPRVLDQLPSNPLDQGRPR